MKKLTILSNKQRIWLRRFAKDNAINLNINTFEGVLYLLKTGCQWRMIPQKYGHWRSLYHYFRSWSERKWFHKLQRKLLWHSRIRLEQRKSPTTIVIDSQSVKSGLSKSIKGIDGNKKIKGSKRHISVDSNGLPLGIVVTTANVHDSKVSHKLIASTLANYPTINTVKADNGYRGKFADSVNKSTDIDIQCVKSNFGTSEFIPINGRWVVERTISWLDNYRRLARNYEQHLHTASAMAKFAFIALMLNRIL